MASQSFNLPSVSAIPTFTHSFYHYGYFNPEMSTCLNRNGSSIWSSYVNPCYHQSFQGIPYQPADEEKPTQSYIGLIGKAILSSPQQKLVLGDIYNYILTNYPYFRNKGPGWRNSIRHNLSLNDCFVKLGRSPNGKGHFWAINPLNYEDFSRGEYKRKRATRRNRERNGTEIRTNEISNNYPAAQTKCKSFLQNRGFHIETLLSNKWEEKGSAGSLNTTPAFAFVAS